MSNPTGLPNPFTDAEIAYICDNHHNTPVEQMARHLGRGNQTIYKHMDENSLKVYRSVFSNYKRKAIAAIKTKSEFFEYDKNWII